MTSSESAAQMLRRPALLGVLLSLTFTQPHCGGASAPPEATSAAKSDKPVITNRVDIPQAVRQSLGITFVSVQERVVGASRRLAGRVSTTFEGMTPYHAMVPGVVTVHVGPLDPVEPGQLLASVSSPELLEHRHALHLAGDAVGAARDALSVELALAKELSAEIAHTNKRIARLAAAGVAKAELRASAATARRRLPVSRARVAAMRRALLRSEHRFEAELASFAGRVGLSVAALEARAPNSADHGDKPPRWETLDALEVRAHKAGIVSKLPVRSGGWIDVGGLVAEVTDPAALWVVGRALASDVGKLHTGQSVAVVPSSTSEAASAAVSGTLLLGLNAAPENGTVPVHVRLAGTAEWLRPGVAVFADVSVGGSAKPEPAVPVASLIRDGLQTVFFRRDPADPDKVIRVEADLGTQDEQWAVVFSGVAPGDEVVVDGAYELKLASTKRPDVIGHFHADGTFHEGKD